MIRLPLKVAEFINEHYPGKNYVNHKKQDDVALGKVYLVYLNDDDKCYQLWFNETGRCIYEYSEPLKPDFHEQYY